ncbi:spore germination protein [Peribacillus frigoritolerans]|uniref:spore germination protein n=1 Tax=Peribacillus frigoritolerans TaxID=450367 RepID=UPI00207A3E7C|nr:spore germination protein [Peribacillus frigoritolerans]USK64943.1 spore germination protein [Peribacillus frigoritolerans]
MRFRKSESKKKKQGNLPKKDSENVGILSLEKIKSQLNYTDDLKDRDIHIDDQIYVLLYITSLVDQEKLESKVIEPIIETLSKVDNNISNLVYSQGITSIQSNESAINGLLDGNCLLMEKGNPKEGYLLEVNQTIGRLVNISFSENTVTGPNESFVENVNINISLLRKRVKTPNFTFKKYSLGSETTVDVALIYVDKLVNPDILQKVDERLKSIDLDSIRSSGDIQDFIEDHTFSPFPQILVTERPDRAAANLMDGRVVLVIDGDPSVFVLPATIMMFFHSQDDDNSRWYLGSFFRILRLIGFVNALLLPAIYIAIVSYHLEIIPMELIYSLQSSLSYVPFRPIVELILMQISLELLREASIRLPPVVAQTFGIVGALVVGTAMVEAGLVSYGGLIIVAITAVSSFVQPNIEMSSTIRVLGFPLMLLAAMFGFVGIAFGVFFLLIHLSRLTSFGVPYFTPFAPLNIREFKNTVIRIPKWMQDNHSNNPSPSKRGNRSRKWKSHESEEPY